MGGGKLITLDFLKPAKEPCYSKNKGKFGIWKDGARAIFQHGTLERGYWMYGFYNKTKAEQDKYIDYASFMKKRNELNKHPKVTFTTGERFNYLCMLRDKFVFGRFLSSLGFPIPEDLFLIDGQNGTIRKIGDNKVQSLDHIVDYDFDGFCKIVSGECGNSVFRLSCKDGQLSGEVDNMESLKKLIGKSMFVVQKRLEQHPAISAVYPHSINTIRLITCMSPSGKISVIPSVIRFGANGNVVDNWFAGGLAVAIDDNGVMKGNGIYEFPINGVIEAERHPDTNIKFEGIEIPYYKEAVETASKLHRFFYGIPCIGWDIAITDRGPVFVEGNDNFEISLNQAVHGGLRDKWLESIGMSIENK